MPTIAALSGQGRNLRPYQFQIGDVIFGRHTPYPVEKVDIQSYNVNNQDFQVPMSNETRMGIDTKQAGPMTFTMGVIDNAPAHGVANLPEDLIAKSSLLLTTLQNEWKATAASKQWGELKPLIYCDGYGSVRRIYGRPRKFSYTRKTPKSQFYRVTAEYARVDTLTYSDIEYAASLVQGADPVDYSRLGGDADTWLRVLLQGPMTNPVIYIGDTTIQLQISLDTDTVLELSSYPWARRIVSAPTAGGTVTNQRRTLIGDTRYLDQIMMPAGESVAMKYTATGTTSATECLVLWRDAYNVV